ncbi:MAG: hypothetical protein ABI707_12355 [Ferruginibacter sp.]
MPVAFRINEPWTRKHDNPQTPHIPMAPKIYYPQSLEEVIEICSNRPPNEFLKAAGSHWALSDAAISDNSFVETHDPNNVLTPMGRTLYEVVPGCLNKNFVTFLGHQHPKQFGAPDAEENEGIYLAHFETGKRVYQLYSELDLGEDANDPNGKSLAHLINREYSNPDYFGSWAFETLGGAAGQTVFGALTTGTHGGDFRFPPIADSVLAMHLVADGGKHFWIERETYPDFNSIPITDDSALNQLYGDDLYKGKKTTGLDNFKIIRNDDLFNAVLISAGRFGIVYSVIIRAVRQYCLHEERRLDNWQNIKSLIHDSNSSLFTGNTNNRFLQIAISVTPYLNFTKNLCGITTRWNVPSIMVTPGTSSPCGRLERRGNIDPNHRPVYDSRIRAPWFDNAGNSFGYNPDPNKPNTARSPGFFDIASENSDFLTGVINEVLDELSKFVDNNIVVAGGVIAAVAIFAPVALGIVALVLAIAALIEKIRELLDDKNIKPTHFAGLLNSVADILLSDPKGRAAGIFVWQCISYLAFQDQQGNVDFEAISYAVMDRFSYLDKSEQVNVDSIEVFFDANDTKVIAFVDSLLLFEIAQELSGKVFIGYISLRFTTFTRALIGMQRFTRTVAVEVSGLADAGGSRPLIDFALRLAANPNFGGIVHWGQRNNQTMDMVQSRFGDSLSFPAGNLHTWRRQLSGITDNGRLNGFSSNFTRTLGLEVVEPVMGSLIASRYSITTGGSVTITWDCTNNPPNTEFRLKVTLPNGIQRPLMRLAFAGTKRLILSNKGITTISLIATCTLNNESRVKDIQIFIEVI